MRVCHSAHLKVRRSSRPRGDEEGLYRSLLARVALCDATASVEHATQQRITSYRTRAAPLLLCPDLLVLPFLVPARPYVRDLAQQKARQRSALPHTLTTRVYVDVFALLPIPFFWGHGREIGNPT